MRIGSKGVTYVSLPPNLQTPENYALTVAFDCEMSRLIDYLEKLQLWTALDKADVRYYDQMASNLRALYYQSDYSNIKKLGIIKKALQIYTYAGTQLAVQELLNSIFDDAKFIPWYEYEGLPYHFKIKVTNISSENTVAKFNTILAKVKAKREILDVIEIFENDVVTANIIYVAGTAQIIKKNLG